MEKDSTTEKVERWVLSLPIRNWNNAHKKKKYPLFSSFESTYKELKPVYFFKYFHCIYRFESTYKELKLFPHGFFFTVHGSFESTYKELKLA